MDPYTIGVLLKSLLASAGLKTTVLLLVVGGILYGGWKAVSLMGGFLRSLLDSRDRLMAQTMERVALQDQQRASHEADVARIQERHSSLLGELLDQAKRTREEMHERFGGMFTQHTAMEKQLSRIEGRADRRNGDE